MNRCIMAYLPFQGNRGARGRGPARTVATRDGRASLPVLSGCPAIGTAPPSYAVVTTPLVQ